MMFWNRSKTPDPVYPKNLKNRFFGLAKAPIIDDRKLVRIALIRTSLRSLWSSILGSFRGSPKADFSGSLGIFPSVNFDHHRIVVEKNEKISVLSPSEMEALFQIIYLPCIQFQKSKEFISLYRKTEKYHKKGLLEQRQLWLGSYFRKEIQFPSIPPIRLRWIDDKIGWGVFAEQDLSSMQYIGEYAGIVRRKKRADSKNAYCFQYSLISGESSHYTIDALNHGGIVRFINHSSRPNLMSALATHQNFSHIVIFAARPIKKGEQLCYDYGPDYWKRRLPPQELLSKYTQRT